VDVVNIASWTVVSAAAGRLLTNWQNERRQRLERLAVVSEYEDDRTSEGRKHLLTLRYPQYVVRHPDLRYFRKAQEQIDADRIKARKERRAWLKASAQAAALWTVIAAVMFLVLVGHFTRFDPPIYGSASGQAWSFVLTFVTQHLWGVTVCVTILLYFTVAALRVLQHESGVFDTRRADRL
jgi:hypothetical protein